MRNVVLLEHVSLDGFLAGPNGEMDWIRVDDELFDAGAPLTDDADTAIYGRVTYEMMAAYWPTAADKPGASRHEVSHGRWVNAALKLVFSKTLASTDWPNTRIVRDDPAAEIARLKQAPGKNLLLIGSPSLARSFIAADLIDDYRLFVNPVVLGAGMRLFPADARADLELQSATKLASGVVGLHYRKT